jgi:prephenate dehydratase
MVGPRVAFLGPEHSFTHLAALALFGGDAEYLAEASIAGVFAAVEGGRADYGVAPVENSIEGPVGETLDCLASSMLHVYAAAEARIILVLAGSGPRRVYGHPHALGEARGVLARLLPGAELAPAMSTGEAARLAAEQGGYCVCSRRAAEAHGLPVVAEGVERGENYTRFIAVSWRDQAEKGERTSILAAIPDRPGALYEWLGPFAERGVDLAMIYSRPIPSRPWHYVFYVDLAGGRLEEKVAGAIEEARARSLFLRVLGSYPVLRGLVF